MAPALSSSTCRLRTWTAGAHQHRQRHQEPGEGAVGQRDTQNGAEGGEAHVDPGEEQDQAHIGVQNPEKDAQERDGLQPQGEDLENQEEGEDGQQGHCHFLHIGGELSHIGPTERHRIGQLGRLEKIHGDGGDGIKEAQHLHGQDRADGAERDQTEAVGLGVFVGADGGHADAQRHDKGHGHRPCGDAAGVKGHGVHGGGNDQNQHKGQTVDDQQQRPQGDGEEDAQHAQGQEQAHAHGHRQDQNGGVDCGHALGQHLQIRLGHADGGAQQKAHQNDQPELAGAGELGADGTADPGHGHLGPQGEKPHPDDQEERAEQKGQKQPVAHRHKDQAQQRHDQRDGQHRGGGFFHFFQKYLGFQHGQHMQAPLFLYNSVSIP